ncbi:hypothetical protein BT96DRAFT_1020711 [Gymnopus androsaceus JB14]|uniref:Uncharacterized protein n=1 Tax=Gymnopus androsaceus JB14 TaxID=1447944 RepID=A0A6A4HJD2_9AGAR|nr:hypothetical protein BT96DRAFT_1020711 [Gymnopus androsaceus JB14]
MSLLRFHRKSTSNHPLPSNGDSESVEIKRIDDLISISLACRFLCTISLPLAFESVIIRSRLGKDCVWDRYRRSYITFCQSLNEDGPIATALASQIQNCTIRRRGPVPTLQSQPLSYLRALLTPSLPHERAIKPRTQDFESQSHAYCEEQSTQPQTLAYSPHDPLAGGSTAWIYEKLIKWSDKEERICLGRSFLPSTDTTSKR